VAKNVTANKQAGDPKPFDALWGTGGKGAGSRRVKSSGRERGIEGRLSSSIQLRRVGDKLEKRGK